MKLIVNPHKIELVKEQAVNEKEIDISKCRFEFADEITENYVKEAYFTLNGESYKQIIVNNECSFPQEVLVKEGTVEVGVVAYLVENENEIKRYNPTPVYFKTDLGSLKEAENSEPITPSEMEQYEQALQDGLTEVNGKLEDIDTAITQANNLDLDASKSGNITTVTITKKNGTTKEVEILDGEQGETGPQGPAGPEGPAGKDGKDGADGQDGQDGYSPSASVSKEGNTVTITITDKNGTTSASVSDGTTPDLTDYVKNTDYATNDSTKSGVVKLNISTYCAGLTNNTKELYAVGISNATYNNSSDNIFISKGTLENVIIGKQLTDKTYVDNSIANAITNTLGGSY